MSLFQVVERLARQANNTLAAVDEVREEGSVLPSMLTYGQLHDAACRISAALAGHVQAGQLVGTHMPRGNDWYATFLGAARLEVATVGLSTDLPDKELEAKRNDQIMRELRPALLVVSGSGSPQGIEAVFFSKLWAESEGKTVHPNSGSGDAQLCFQYTGGSTGASRCAIATHRMALWEVSNYPAVAKLASSDRVLQQHSIYWAASAIGEVNIALAFGCALVFCKAWHSEELSDAICTHQISCAGLVPSFLDSMEPSELPSLKLVFTWGEALQPRAARRWAKRLQLIDLLISTECWLSLYADWSSDFSVAAGRPAFRILPGTHICLVPPDGQAESPRVKPFPDKGELLVAGPMVSPGYTDQAHNASSFLEEAENRWYRTRDCLERRPCGGFVFTGRANDLMKISGVWVDSREVSERLDLVEGVVASCIFNGMAFVQLESLKCGAMHALRRVLPATIGLFVVPTLPMHPATGKVDRTQLESLVGLRRDHAPSTQQGILASLRAWQWFLALLCFWRLVCVLSLEIDMEQRLLQAAWMFAKSAFRFLCLSYMMLCRLHCPCVEKGLGYLPLGGPTELATAAALLPWCLLALLALPGVLLAWWRARLLSWPLICVVGFPLWSRNGSAWLFSTGYRNVLDWYLSILLKKLPMSVKSFFKFHKKCQSCKQELFYTEGFIDISVDTHWHCRRCWSDYHRHWECRRCKKWVSRGREEQSLAGWVCLRCATALDAEKAAVTASDAGLENASWAQHYQASRHSDEPQTKRAKLELVCPFRTPRNRNMFVLGAKRLPQAAASSATTSAAPALTFSVEKSPQWRLVEKAVGFAFSMEEEELVGIDSLRLTKLRSALLREEGKHLSMDSLRRCKTLRDLLQEIDSVAPVQQDTVPSSSAGGMLKFYCRSRKRDELPAWGMMWNSKCLWTLHHAGPIDAAVLKQAVGELLRRHAALRSEPADPMRLFTAVQETLSVLTLLRLEWEEWEAGPLMRCFFAAVAWSLKEAWPRLRATSPDVDRVMTELEMQSTRDRAEACVRSARNARPFKPPFELIFAPYEGGLVLQICVTHMLADGFCIVPLMTDLASLVAAAEQGNNSSKVSAQLPSLQNPLQVLFSRIERTINADTSLADTITPQRLDEPPGSQDAISLRAVMPQLLVEDVRRTAALLAVTDEVVMLAALGVTMAKLDQKVTVSIQMVVPQRDGPGASDMVAMFSDYRCLDIPTEGLSYAGVALSLYHMVKERLWRAPLPTGQSELPFVNFEWTDFEERHGFSQIVDAGRSDTSVQTPMKLVVDQPDSQSWRVAATFKTSLYKEDARKRFFPLLDEALLNLIEDPLKLVWP
eukprot:TRINITY_DN27064_c0_g1_i1.p1 TRINITY_DN27064_c0_g1~~TRINITY_DN27064_c0_g1_i1.p1  ORF type:complete len:1328 (+),score=219.18 TRINITY_DN27064_c0_g1_i1:54-4037(+)